MTDKTIEEELKEVMAAAEEAPEKAEIAEDVVEETIEPEAEEQAEVEKTVEEKPVEIKSDVDDTPPVALSPAMKAKWKDLPEDVRAEWKKRENDMHFAFTRHDSDLIVGRKIKEIAAPYEAIIRSEGGTVEGAFKDLLNTSYILRAGSPQQKAQAVMQAIQQFGVDLSLVSGQQQANPLSAIQQEIQALRQQADPVRIKTQLQEEMTRDRITSEIEAFAANPSNVHFETVKSQMGALISTGRAKDLQEAYDMAIWSDPSIRSELLKAQQAQEAEKKKAEMAAKRKASASVSGSPGLASPNSNAPQKSIEDEIRDNLRASSGKI